MEEESALRKQYHGQQNGEQRTQPLFLPHAVEFSPLGPQHELRFVEPVTEFAASRRFCLSLVQKNRKSVCAALRKFAVTSQGRCQQCFFADEQGEWYISDGNLKRRATIQILRGIV